MGRKVELWDYLPTFLQDFREMRELFKTENPEFQELCATSEGLIDEVFILTASETGISRLEKIMGISPAFNESLENRRNTVMTRWYNAIPYTMKALKNRIISLQGNSNVQTGLDAEQEYTLNIVTRLEKRGQVDDLAYILNSMIPCNLVIHSDNRIECASETKFGLGAGVVLTQSAFLTNDLNETLNIPLSGGAGIGLCMTEALFLTDTLHENVEIGVPGFFGIGNCMTSFININ